ncbi:NAD-dependent epimerase/dehydratase family protein [Alteromonas pelagimontana]|uniref:NAD-dependent epimerase/dehydratase family protein n=1 Tax=Alteromonas pelagimontana TaxID=1858656 RepID=A0A6M4MDI0_9ALTE|nr:vitamin K epoxide reductase family protein [Alteromonas pelagimontana]QJR80690.1 NAD-dependent epimerase/dehydratase family protein [Alteromonas pelagimontana]
MVHSEATPVVLITGASGDVGAALCHKLKQNYFVIGLDLKPADAADTSYECDFTSPDSIKLVMQNLRRDHGDNIASVIHLAAFFDFTGEPNPLYQKLNVDGTKLLLEALQSFTVEHFVYASTMLVHEPAVPGIKVTEETPLDPGWAYPDSKANAEAVIKEAHGKIPYTILRMAGLYDEHTAVPTLSYQIARIYERQFKSWLYSGDLMAGQSFLHKDDMVALFATLLDKRATLPSENILLAGEENVMGYQALQNRIGQLIHGEEEWKTIEIPEFVAKPGAWLQEKSEPIVPDAIDHGEKPFIKPFMIDLSSDHYDLDIRKVKEQIGWTPKHNIYEELEHLIGNLKANPPKWYKANGITKPDWMQTSEEKHINANTIREEHEEKYRQQHYQFIWAHFINLGLAFWLLTAPFILGYESQMMRISDMASGGALLVFGSLALSWRMGLARWAVGAVGLWLLSAPLVFWAPTAGAYLNGTLVGMLVIGFSVCSRPTPGVAQVAAETGPNIPPGWEFNPSSWVQRLPIIILAFIGFFISRYLCAYQLGHIDAVWEPFFTGVAGNPKNGTEEIITSSVSKAWPVPDAGLGALTYALEILTGLMGSVRRWRTMPWLVMLFGFMIVPLGAVSIVFIIIQPIVLGTWCTLCLIGAAAMLIQIPYSLDELIATSEFLYRRKKQGRPLLRIFFTGDTDEGERKEEESEFKRGPIAIIKDMVGGGVTIPWNLALCLPIGLWLMFTRLTLGSTGTLANADHIVGSLVLTVAITALAESARAVRFLLIPLGAALFVTPFLYGADLFAIVSSVLCGVLLIGLGLRKGHISNQYGIWNKAIV